MRPQLFLPAALAAVTALAVAGAAAAQAEPRVLVQCKNCHTFDKGDDPSQGPNLWGVYGAKSATRPDFTYSSTLRKANIVWTPENLDKWLTKPANFLPGTKMAFAGLKKPEDRAAVIAYLKGRGG